MSRRHRPLSLASIDAARLVPVIPALPAETLHQLVRHLGVVDSIGLLVAATPDQIAGVLDLDLWPSPQAGHDVRFDVDRFGEWVEALVDYDAAEAARIAAGIDADLVAIGLFAYVRVADPATFLPTEASDDEARVAHEGPTGPTAERGGYFLRARRADAWDAILTLLGALEAAHESDFHRVMRRCRRLSNRGYEKDGLDTLLAASDQWQYELAALRADRRSAQGYTTVSDARAFLKLARDRGRTWRERTADANPIATTYFREEDVRAVEMATSSSPVAEPPALTAASTAQAVSPAALADAHAALAEVMRTLAESGVAIERPRALLAAPEGAGDRCAVVRAAMQHLHAHDVARYDRCTRELAFLTNTLPAGSAVRMRPFTADEASDAAVSLCNLGLDVVHHGAPRHDDVLANRDLVSLFEIGWATIYDDVSMFTAHELIGILGALRIGDPDMLRGVHEFRHRLRAATERGTPWDVGEELDVLSPFDMLSWMSLLGLFSECPVVTDALTALVERRTGQVSATAFDFIATRAQIDRVQAFVARLPELFGA